MSVNIVFVNGGTSNFEYAQIYVALSRVRKLDGLFLMEIDPDRIRCNDEVYAEYCRLRTTSAHPLKQLPVKH